MNRLAHITAISLAITLLCSCQNYEKLLKGNDFEAKYNAAVKLYNEKSYGRANQLFENLTLHYRDRDKAEDILWYYANSLMKSGDYYTAAYQFLTLTRRFPYSTHAEEAAFLSAYCKYQDSPVYSLDQSMTNSAIDELEHFAEKYPQSVHIPEVNAYLDELREKLMLKDYENAYGYYVTEQYHAAYISLQHFISVYPDSPKREDAMFYSLKSGYEYAINSREDKMKERLQQVVNDFDRFATTFKNSKYLSASQTIYTKCKAQLAALESAGKAKNDKQ